MDIQVNESVHDTRYPQGSRRGGLRGWCAAHRPLGLVSMLLILAACAQNPVTGERELGLVSTGQEIAIGLEHYPPSQQMQGGDYVLDPELQDYVSGVNARLARVSDRGLPYEVTVLNSSVPNAWALPGGKMAINRGLLVELDSEAELAAVLGHEIVHAAARHGAQAMERGMFTQGAMVAAAVAMSASGRGEYANLALGAAQIGAQLITQKYGRDAERESDSYGMIYMQRAGYDPAAAVSLQETFVRLSEGRGNSDWLSGLFASHPPSEERVANNRAFAAELGPGGEIGRERYQQATALLRSRQPGYDKGDAARKALQEKQWNTALVAAEDAIELLPGEARFHGLAGDAHAGAGRMDQALARYDRAVDLDSSYYAHWQQRGMANLALERTDAAQRDLEQAMSLLPTAQSSNALGQIALAAGRTDAARQYLAAAASSDSSAGQQARLSLARLDIGHSPQQFVPARWGIDSDGTLVAELRNQAPFAVDALLLELSVRDPQGRVGNRQLPVDGRLEPGTARTLRTGLRLPEGITGNDVSLRVVRAREAR